MANKFVPEDYIERAYAGWLGKIIGVRHGSSKKVYGELDQARYLFDFTNFAADDDTNGPIFFIRVLKDYLYIGINGRTDRYDLAKLRSI